MRKVIFVTVALALLMFSSVNAQQEDQKLFQMALSMGLAEMAVRTAQAEGIETVAFSGGVANNHMITETIRRRIDANGLRFLRHRRVPAGDGGTSLGQAVAAAFRDS